MTNRACRLAFVTAAVTLAMQILVHRLVSAKLLNHYAFLVISLTMLGFAVSGVILSRLLPRILSRLGDSMIILAALTGLSAVMATAVFYRAPATFVLESGRLSFIVGFMQCMPSALPFAVPFTFCGLILGSLLSAPELPTRRVYFYDLLGSACGAVGVLPLLTHVGAETALLIACGVLIVATALLMPVRSTASRWVAAGTVLLLLVTHLYQDQVFWLRYPEGSMLADTQQPGGAVIEHIAWDPVGRVELTRIPPLDPSMLMAPALLGDNREFVTGVRRVLTQNNFAFTFVAEYDGRPESLAGIEETIYFSAYKASSKPQPRVLVIGAGGGFDVLAAIRHGAERVVAVEVNGAMVRVLKDTHRHLFRDWLEDPRVQVVHGEGRHLLATSSETYDIIQLSEVDSYSGTVGSPHVFSENYLFTSEAFDLYLSRLTPAGILCVMSAEFTPAREVLRYLTTVVATLRRMGVARPAGHIAILTSDRSRFVAMLVKRTPFEAVEVDRLQNWAGSSPHFQVTAAPWGGASPQGVFQRFLELDEQGHGSAFVVHYPFDIRPTDDNRPFAFRYSYWWHLTAREGPAARSVPVMELSVVMLLVMISAVLVLCVFLPLRWLASRGLHAPQRGRYAFVFAGTGIGYLALEMALLQRFGLLLGHPNFALSVVLASLLFSSGLGSLWSRRIMTTARHPRFVSYLLSGILLAEYGLVLPVLSALVTLSFFWRCVIVFAAVAPIGLLLGTYLPSALDGLKQSSPAFVPWAWGVNGICSVLSPVLSVAFTMTWGIGALMVAAIPVYLAVGWCFPPSTLDAGSGLRTVISGR